MIRPVVWVAAGATSPAASGELSLQPEENDLKLLQAQLGINAQSTSENKAASTEPISAIPSAIVKAKRKQVGIRNPKRDPIGKKEYEIA